MNQLQINNPTNLKIKIKPIPLDKKTKEFLISDFETFS